MKFLWGVGTIPARNFIKMNFSRVLAQVLQEWAMPGARGPGAGARGRGPGPWAGAGPGPGGPVGALAGQSGPSCRGNQGLPGQIWPEPLPLRPFRARPRQFRPEPKK